MPIVVACPSCQTRLKVPDQSAGKMVKCPKCSAAISVPLAGNEPLAATPPAAAPPPASGPAADIGTAATGDAAAPKKSKKGLYIGLGVGAFLLLSCCCLGVGGGIGSYILFFAGERNDKVTKANYDAIMPDMILFEIETKLGPGKPTTLDDVKAAYKTLQKPEQKAELDKVIKMHEAAIAKDADYRWRNGDDFIFVIFDKSAKDKGKAVTVIWCGNSSTPPQQLQKPNLPK